MAVRQSWVDLREQVDSEDERFSSEDDEEQPDDIPHDFRAFKVMGSRDVYIKIADKSFRLEPGSFLTSENSGLDVGWCLSLDDSGEAAYLSGNRGAMKKIPVEPPRPQPLFTLNPVFAVHPANPFDAFVNTHNASRKRPAPVSAPTRASEQKKKPAKVTKKAPSKKPPKPSQVSIPHEKDYPAKVVTADELTCKLCLTNQMNLLFLPCEHVCTCVGCANQLRAFAIEKGEKTMSCLTCKAPVHSTQHVFLA